MARLMSSSKSKKPSLVSRPQQLLTPSSIAPNRSTRQDTPARRTNLSKYMGAAETIQFNWVFLGTRSPEPSKTHGSPPKKTRLRPRSDRFVRAALISLTSTPTAWSTWTLPTTPLPPMTRYRSAEMRNSGVKITHLDQSQLPRAVERGRAMKSARKNSATWAISQTSTNFLVPILPPRALGIDPEHAEEMDLAAIEHAEPATASRALRQPRFHPSARMTKMSYYRLQDVCALSLPVNNPLGKQYPSSTLSVPRREQQPL